MSHDSRLRILLVSLMLLCGLCASSFAQSQSRGPKISRIFVPAGKPEAWPPGDWVPITTERLQSLLSQQSKPQPKTLVVNETRLFARFDPQRNALVDGRAVVSFGEKTPTDRLVALSPLNVAIRNAQWTRTSDRPVVMGYDDAQQLHVAVPPDSGELQFEWQLAGTSRLNGTEFEVRLPRTIVGEVSVEVPKEWSLSAGATALKVDAPSNGQQRYVVNVVPGQTLRLLLIPESLKSPEYAASTSLLYRQATTIQLSRGRIDQRSDFSLDALSVVPAQWQMPIPKDWVCDAVSLNGRLLTAAEWSLGAKDPKAGGTQLLSVPLSNGNGLIAPTISVRLSRTLGPRVSFATCVCPAPKHDRAAMLSGQVDLQIVSSLALVRHQVKNLRQTEVRSDEGIERLTFQQDRADAELTLHWADQSELLRIKSRQFVVVNLEDSPASFLMDLEVEPLTGSLFDLTVALPRQWELSEVLQQSGSSSGRRLDWTVATGENDQQLKVSFPDGVPANSGVLLRLNGHYVGPTKANDLSAPIGLLSRSTPDAVIVALAAPSTAATLVAAHNRFLIAAPEVVAGARTWTQLAKVATSKNARLWVASGLDSTVNLRESRVRTQGNVDTGSPSVPGPATATPVKPSESKTLKSAFQPFFSAKLRSTLSPGRSSRDQHELSLKLLYPTEGGLLEFQLPANAQLQHVEWHEQRIAATSVGTKLSVPLQSPKPGDELQIHYTLPAEALFLRETYQIELPTVAVPIDGVEWEVRLPQRFMVVRFPGGFVATSESKALRPHWLAWLFGPLARKTGDRVFNPFNARDWQPLFVEDGGSVREWASDDSWDSYVAHSPRVAESMAIEVCDRQRLAATAWLIMAATACIGVLLRATKTKQRGSVAVIWLTIAMALTVLIPSAYAELMGATIVGSVITCLIPRGLIRRDPRAPSQRNHDRHFAPTVTVQQGLLGLLLIALSYRAIVAQDSGSTTAVESIDLLIEYEGDRFAQPLKTGLICVTSQSLAQLTKNAAPVTSAPNALFQSASYEGEWSINGLSKIAAKWEIWLPQGPTVKNGPLVDEVVLPIPLRAFADLGQVTCDGKPLEVIPKADGQSVRVRVPRLDSFAQSATASPPLPEVRVIPLSDKWRLVTIRTELRPLPQKSHQEVAWQVSVPRTLSADVVIRQPDPVIARPTFSSGWVLRAGRPGEGSFDPVSDIRLIQRRPDAKSSQPTVQVKLKSFVDVTAEATRRLTLGQYSVEDGELRQVAFKLPPHAVVQTERVVAPQLRAAQVRRTATETLLLCEFSTPQTDDFSVAISWLLPDRKNETPKPLLWERPVSPLAPFADLGVKEHIAGVSTGLGFVWRPVNNIPTSLGSEGEAEFLNGWPSGLSLRSPQFVWNVVGQPAPQWKLMSNVSEKAARWTTVVEVDRDNTAWLLAADLDVAGAPAFVHEIDIDPRLTIESVTVTQDDVNRLAYWTRQNDRLFLHLKDRVTGPHKLLIVARESNRADEIVSHPRCELVGAKTGDITLKVMRSRGVIVDVAGAEATPNTEIEIEGETRFASMIDVGTYRAKAQTDSTFVVRLLPVVSRSWCAATVDSTSSEPIVELSLTIEPGSLERTVLKLPDWPIAAGVVAEIDGDPSATIVPQLDAPGQWVIAMGKNSDIPLHVFMRVPILEPDDMLAVDLSSPLMDDIEEQTVGWLSLSRRQEVAADASVNLSGSKQNEMLERGIISPTLIGIPIVNWKQTRLSVPRTSSTAERFRDLPTLAQHDVWLGDREQIAGRTTLLSVAAAHAIEVQLPLQVELQACLVNGVPRTVNRSPVGLLLIPVDDADVFGVVELLWQYVGEVRSLRIGQRQIALPQIRVEKLLVRAEVALSENRRLLPISEEQGSRSAHWHAALSSWQDEVALRPSLMTKGMQNVLQRFSDMTTGSNEESPETKRVAVRFEMPREATLRLWVIDERLDRFVMALVIALIVAPLVRILIQFRTGDWLASRPAIAFAALSSIWWLCLSGSGWGLTALIAALVTAVVNWLQERTTVSELSYRAASASPSKSRHTF